MSTATNMIAAAKRMNAAIFQPAWTAPAAKKEEVAPDVATVVDVPESAINKSATANDFMELKTIQDLDAYMTDKPATEVPVPPPVINVAPAKPAVVPEYLTGLANALRTRRESVVIQPKMTAVAMASHEVVQEVALNETLAHFDKVFSEIKDQDKVVAYNPAWENKTEYLDNAVDGADALKLETAMQVVSTDAHQRRIIITSTEFGNVVVFERYAPSFGSKNILVFNAPTDEALEDLLPQSSELTLWGLIAIIGDKENFIPNVGVVSATKM